MDQYDNRMKPCHLLMESYGSRHGIVKKRTIPYTELIQITSLYKLNS